jgi:hypothetical protein
MTQDVALFSAALKAQGKVDLHRTPLDSRCSLGPIPGRLPRCLFYRVDCSHPGSRKRRIRPV